MPVRSKAQSSVLPGAHRIGEEEMEPMGRVIRAPGPFRFCGPDPQRAVDALERKWGARFDHRHARGVSSGTAALGVAMPGLGIGPGGEVAVPGYRRVNCVAALVRSDAIPLLVDTNDIFCVDPGNPARRIGPNARSTMNVRLSSSPGCMAEVANMRRAQSLKLIEDCTQAAGASPGGPVVGRFGDWAARPRPLRHAERPIRVRSADIPGDAGLPASECRGNWCRCDPPPGEPLRVGAARDWWLGHVGKALPSGARHLGPVLDAAQPFGRQCGRVTFTEVSEQLPDDNCLVAAPC